MNNKLDFKNVTKNPSLVAVSTYSCIKNLFSEEEQKNILVAEIDSEYMDGIKLCEHYNIDIKTGANCLVCECKKEKIKLMLHY